MLFFEHNYTKLKAEYKGITTIYSISYSIFACLKWFPEQQSQNAGMVASAIPPALRRQEAGGPEIQGNFSLHGEFKASMR